jgi:hypothetical protein
MGHLSHLLGTTGPGLVFVNIGLAHLTAVDSAGTVTRTGVP